MDTQNTVRDIFDDGGMGPEVSGTFNGHELAPGLITALRTVYDPEIPVNLLDMGLIYNINIDDDKNVDVEMTLTAPGCPVAEEMPEMVASALRPVEGVGKVKVEIVWEPPWTMDRMSEIARVELGMF